MTQKLAPSDIAATLAQQNTALIGSICERYARTHTHAPQHKTLLRAILEDVQASTSPLTLWTLASESRPSDFAHDIGCLLTGWDFESQTFRSGFLPYHLAPPPTPRH